MKTMNLSKLSILCAVLTFAFVVARSDASAQPSLVDELRSRLDLTGVRVAPENAPESLPTVDVDALLAATSQIEQATPGVIRSDGSRIAVQVGHKALEVDLQRGVLRMEDDRWYASNASAVLSRGDLLATAAPVLAAIGADDDNSVALSRTLMKRTRSSTGGHETVERIAEKLLVKRMIGGYPVQGERLVLSFAPDGSLRGISGRWHTVDLSASRLNSSLSRSEVGERALEAVAQAAQRMHLVPADNVPVRVYTFLTPQQTESGNARVVPMGRIEVPVMGKDKNVTSHGIDFPI